MQKYKVNSIVKATVTGIENYGAFVTLDEYYSGLIHISEVSNKYVSDLTKLFTIGSVVKVKVLEIDEDKLSQQKTIDTQMEFEPSAQSILQKLVPMFLTNTILQALFEANASELASRMTAMSAATDNAGKMIHDLSIEYNKARQAAITNELTEIIAGADALNN